MAKRESGGRNERRSTGDSFRVFAFGALISQLMVLKYLFSRWPPLEHPLEPPLSIPRNFQNDATFYGVPVAYQQGIPPSTSMQCIGETFEPDTAWMFRSCLFQNLCYDVNEQEFVYIMSLEELALKKSLGEILRREFVTISTLAAEGIAVSLAAFRPLMTPEQELSLKWFPKIISKSELSTKGYFQMPGAAAWVPLMGESLGARDSSERVVWRDLFPIYSLLSTFGVVEDGSAIEPFLFLFNDLSAGDMYIPFLELFGSSNSSLGFTKGGKQLQVTATTGFEEASLVCAKQTAAGIGMISDRGFNLADRWTTQRPGYVPKVPHAASVPLVTHNMAQGNVLKGFRDYMLRNLKITSSSTSETINVSFHDGVTEVDSPEMRSELSSMNFNLHFEGLQRWTARSIRTIAQKTASSSILVVPCCDDEAALVATFLPDQALLLIVYDAGKHGTSPIEVKLKFPVWDLIDSSGYLRTHWISLAGNTLTLDAVRSIRQHLAMGANRK